MNITELARILKVTPYELRLYLPMLGFDIGQKAIKINRNIANKIIKEWPKLRRKIMEIKESEKAKDDEDLKSKYKNDQIFAVPSLITVKDFSLLSRIPVNIILAELMKNGIFASLNEKIDYDTAWLIGNELGLKIEPKKEEEGKISTSHDLKTILKDEQKDKMLLRPPVIVVMGHVDHGKTKLLDTIRKTNVVAGEAGGITQHIGAYQVARKDNLITFIDTPGHEAFTAMRSRGARIADIAILVVAADDGVMPQTVEAYRIIEAAKIPFVVAINKIDKPEANIDKTKQELSSKLNVIPEDWGGKIPCVPVSAIKGTGIDSLLDLLILISQTEADNIMANPDGLTAGTVIDSHLDKGAGPIATILVQNGTLKIGDQLILNDSIIGKVRNLKSYNSSDIKEAGPSTPAQIIGLKIAPQVGDIIKIGSGEKIRHKKLKKGGFDQKATSQYAQNEEADNVKKFNLIVKSDVLGSAEAIEESLEKINTAEIKAKIIQRGLGNISEGDIKRAEAANAQIFGFNVKVAANIEELARQKNIKIKLYNIIYDLINDVKSQMQALIAPTIKKTVLGKLKVLAIFRSDKNSQIIGGKIIEGTAKKDALFDIERSRIALGKGKITKLQSGKQDVTNIDSGQECGLQTESKTEIQIGDVLNIYMEEEIYSKL